MARWISACSRAAISSPIPSPVPLHRLGGQFQTGQQFQLPAPVIEGSLLAHHLPAAYSGRTLRLDDVEFGVGRKLAAMTVPAQVVGARYIHPAHGGENRLGAQFPVVSLVTARTRKAPLVGCWSCPLQQFGEGGGGLVHRRAQRHLDGFQIPVACLAPPAEQDAQ